MTRWLTPKKRGAASHAFKSGLATVSLCGRVTADECRDPHLADWQCRQCRHALQAAEELARKGPPKP